MTEGSEIEMPGNPKIIQLLFVLICLSVVSVNGQIATVSDGSYALPGHIVQRPETFLGFPEADDSKLIEYFKDPPKGYGEVPFFWWTGGDTLTRERLLW